MAKRTPAETWDKWAAEDAPDPGELWTRADILAAVERLNIRRPDSGRSLVSERTIRYWESVGVVPKGTAAKQGYRYLLYPWWYVDLLYQVCCYEAKKVRVEDLPGRMRAEAHRLSLTSWGREKDPDPSTARGFGSYIARIVGNALREPTQPPFAPEPLRVAAGFGDQLITLLNTFVAELQETKIPPAADRVRVQFLDNKRQVLNEREISLAGVYEGLAYSYSSHTETTDTKIAIPLSPLDKPSNKA